MANNYGYEESDKEERLTPASPCIRNCCLDNNDICLGCFRYIDEIVNWQGSTILEKKAILNQCLIRKNVQN